MAATEALRPTLPPAAAPRFGRRGWTILLTLCCATFMCGLDFSIVTVALPDIGRSLGFSSVGSLQWVATASLLPSASLLLLFARMADLYGRKRLFTVGVTLFTAFSALAMTAGSPGELIAARVGQGAAAAMIAPAAIALMTGYFPEGPLRTRAFGLNGAVMSLGFVLGALGGGVIASGFSWRWTMVVLCLMGALALIGALALPAVRTTTGARRLDIPGAALATIGLFGLVYGISTGADAGWTRPDVLGGIVGGIAVLAAFVVVEGRHPEPLVSPAVLRRPTVSWAGLLGFTTFGMCAGTTVLLSLYMQNVLGFSSLAAGLGYLGEGAAAMLGGMYVPRLLARFPAASVLAAGLAVQGVGTSAMVALPGHRDLALLLVTSSLMGLGHVLGVVSFITVMTSRVPEGDEGVVAGLSQLPQYLAAIGVAGLGAVADGRSKALSHGLPPGRAAVLGGLHVGMGTGGVVAVLGSVLAATLLRRRTAA